MTVYVFQIGDSVDVRAEFTGPIHDILMININV